MKMKKRTDSLQAGFTIVELMIATLVFSLILIVITYGVLHFTSAYYKGLNNSTTQDTARSVMDTVSQAIQFSGTTITPTDGDGGTGTGYFCAANQIFFFIPGVPYEGAAPSITNPGLYAASDNGSCTAPVGSLPPGGHELLGAHMRVAALTVTNLGNQVYTVSVRLAYASGGTTTNNDLLCAPASQANSCASGAANLTDDQLGADDVICKSQIGSQFCAVSALSTTVIRRVSPTPST